MTNGRDPTMPHPDDFGTLALHLPTLPRPPLVSNHSSSLPSTPYQRARTLNFPSRSPSPTKRSGGASPRSTHSESESSSRTQARGPFVAGCKYETGMAHSRRRIPYSVGGEQLERPSSMPKKYLNPAEEGKLSGDMRELYDRILPTRDSDERRAKLVQKLESILNAKWPGNEIKVHVFGSSGNMLCTNDSDVDICITTPMKMLERVCHLAALLAEHGMERVVCVNHAKVPIVKIWDPELELACDMNVNNTLALENTRMIKTYVEIDERVRPLAMIIKYWTRKRILNDAALGGTLSSYTWICMILNFLQTRNPPVLPCLHKRPHQRLPCPDGKLSAFADDLSSLRGFGQKNKETLGELLFHFFRRYAYEIDYEKNVLSVREGQLISKEAKKWHLMQNNRLCVEEPFNTERNLGNTADDISFRGLHIEIRRAFGLIAEAKLSACTEQYQYPAVEEKVWEKPAPKPPPVLTRSNSQSGRGGKVTTISRGGRNGNSQVRGPTGRRASNPTASRLPSLQYTSRGPHPRDNSLQAHLEQLQLHERFLSEYQLLQAQEQQLRILQAQAQLDHVHIQHQHSMVQQSARDLGRSAAMHPPPLTAPIRNSPFFYPFPYPPAPGDTTHNVHTNPSSPSMRPVQPVQPELRRRVDRSSAAESTSSASRSHSQPARTLPLGVPIQTMPVNHMRAAAFQHYQQARQQHWLNAMEQAQRNQRYMENHNPRPVISDQSYEESLPKEYVGYYVHDSPPAHPYRDMLPVSQVPTYSDLQQFRASRPDFSRLRNAPRSPSPSPKVPYRDRSQSVRSSASAPSGLVPFDRTPNHSALRNAGPIIADGSDVWEFHDYVPTSDTPSTSHTSTMSSVNNSSDDRYQFPSGFTTAPIPNHRPADAVNDLLHRPMQGYPVPEVPRAADLFRKTRIEQVLRPQQLPVNGNKSFEPSPRGRVEPSYAVNGLGIQYDGSNAKVKKASPTNGLTQTAPRQGKQGQPTDTQTDKPSQGPESPLKPLPLLSPVREVRSPSPTALLKRRQGIPEQQKPVVFNGPLNLEIPPFSPERYEKRKQKDALTRKSNGKVTPSPVKSTEFPDLVASTPKPQNLPPQINGWQQPSRKGKRKGKGHASQVSLDMNGEPIPADEADRKGG
ncbi:MAG: hypothetical protein LQ348_007485 [Seirophora lacunosa]|nr:MAG: hypothetical protein LQ348_007485 [Seirophora lacunosa]